MNNYFVLNLDTTPPVLNIYAPRYTAKGVIMPVTINANEPLLNYQEIYIVDAKGTRIDLTFQFNGDSFDGLVQLNDCELGIATLYVRLKDEVYNESALYSCPITIIDAEFILITLSEQCVSPQMSEQVLEINFKEEAIKIVMEERVATDG